MKTNVSSDWLRRMRDAAIEALVEGWHADWHMWMMVKKAWRLIGEDPADEIERYTLVAHALRVQRIHAHDRVQTWIPRNMRSLNEMLWNGRSREACVEHAKHLCGGVGKRAVLVVRVRERDKRTDWKTVK